MCTDALREGAADLRLPHMTATVSSSTRSGTQYAPSVLAIRGDEEIRLVPVSDILFCTRTGDYAVVVTSVGEFRISKTLDALEARLARYGFFRAHRAYVVNLQQVRSITVWTRNAYTLVLHGNREVPLSKHRIGLLRRILDW